jgi:hypothetical protein
MKDLLSGIIIAAIILIMVVMIAALAKDCGARRDCEKKGGHVVEYNCHLVTNCHPVTVGKSTIVQCTTTNSCDWRCEGLPAEDPRQH